MYRSNCIKKRTKPRKHCPIVRYQSRKLRTIEQHRNFGDHRTNAKHFSSAKCYVFIETLSKK